MELDLTTIILELINFMVLVWLLQRFLYKPVQSMIRQRQQQIRASLDEATRLKSEAEAVRIDYETRLVELEEEKKAVFQTLEEELQAKRASALQEVKRTSEQEREKVRSSYESKQKQWKREVEQKALQIASAFAGKLLTSVADADLEKRLVGLAVDQLENLADSELEGLRKSTATQPIIVSSAFVMEKEQQDQMSKMLRSLLQADEVTFQTDPSLLAGLYLAAGSWSIGMNLRDELKGFTECMHEQTC